MVKINWDPSRSEIQNFGRVLVISFAVITGLLVWRHKLPIAAYTGMAMGIGLWAWALPQRSEPFYRLWMGLAFVIGTVASYIAMAIVFFLIVTPIGLFLRLSKRDPLKIKKPPSTIPSYWETHDDLSDKSGYRHLY